MIGAAEPRTAVTVVAGPGKAVLLEHLGRDPALARSVVLAAGRAGFVADQPVSGEATVQLGCVCCNVQGDLQRSLRALLPRARRGDVTQVLVDAEIGSDPLAVLTTLITDPVLAAVYRIGGVIAVVGGGRPAGTPRQRPARPGHLPPPSRVMAGLGPATHVFVSTGKVVGARTKPGHDTERSQPRFEQPCYVPTGPYPDAFAVEPGHDEVRGARGVPGLASDPATRRLLMLADRVVALGDEMAAAVQGLNPVAQVIAGLPDAGAILEQDRFFPVTAATDAVVTVTLPDPVAFADLEHRLKESVLHPSSTLGAQRLFGVLNCAGESRPVAVDAVRHHLAPPCLLPAWPDGHTPRSRLVFVGAGLDGTSIQAALVRR